MNFNLIPQKVAHVSEPKLKLQYKLLIKIILEGKPKPICVLKSVVCHMLKFQKRLRGSEGLYNKNLYKILQNSIKISIKYSSTWWNKHRFELDVRFRIQTTWRMLPPCNRSYPSSQKDLQFDVNSLFYMIYKKHTCSSQIHA